jgi:hypothetical protein
MLGSSWCSMYSKLGWRNTTKKIGGNQIGKQMWIHVGFLFAPYTL